MIDKSQSIWPQNLKLFLLRGVIYDISALELYSPPQKKQSQTVSQNEQKHCSGFPYPPQSRPPSPSTSHYTPESVSVLKVPVKVIPENPAAMLSPCNWPTPFIRNFAIVELK